MSMSDLVRTGGEVGGGVKSSLQGERKSGAEAGNSERAGSLRVCISSQG